MQAPPPETSASLAHLADEIRSAAWDLALAVVGEGLRKDRALQHGGRLLREEIRQSALAGRMVAMSSRLYEAKRARAA